jgi:hypothetical protein
MQLIERQRGHRTVIFLQVGAEEVETGVAYTTGLMEELNVSKGLLRGIVKSETVRWFENQLA